MTYDQARVLVTGADGFIGSHLTEALVNAGARVTALALYNSFDSYGWIDELPLDVRGELSLVRGDVRDAAFVAGIVRNQNIVFHLAALIAIPYSYVATQSYVDTNIIGSLNVFEAGRACGTERVVHTSTSEVYGTALSVPIDEAHPLQGQSPYSASKIGADMMAEAFARSFGFPVVILRPFNTYGPRQSERAIVPTLIRQALDPSCAAIMVGATDTVRDLTFVRDTVEAFMIAGQADLEYGRPYNAGSQNGRTVAELSELVKSSTGCSKPVIQEEVRFRPPESEVRKLIANSRRFQNATGWKAQVELQCGIERTIEWWRDRLSEHRVRKQFEFVV